jgi:hypothetical protein
MTSVTTKPDSSQPTGVAAEAFNHAFAAHAGEARQEEAAHRIARALRQGREQLDRPHP